MLLRFARNQLRGIDAWVGPHFDTAMPSLLILGQSDSGVTTRLSTYVRAWIAGKGVTDTTFTAIYNACNHCSASKGSVFGGLSKLDFWNAIAFYNFVPGSSPTTTGHKPSVAALKSGIRPLHLLLDVLRPHGVFIVGLTHSDYSRPIVHAHGIPYVVVPHTRSGVRSSFIKKSFNVLIRISTPKEIKP